LPAISSDKRNALRSFQDVDLATERIDSADRILVQIRDSKSSEPSSMLLTITVRDDGTIDAARPIESPNLSWLLDNQSIQVQPETRVVAKRRSGDRWFVSMRSGNVYGSVPGSPRPMVFGRKSLVGSTADAEGKLLITQHSDGTLLKLDLSNPTQAVWSKLPYQVPEQSSIRLSPNGRELAIWNPQEHSLLVVQTADGMQQRAVPAVAAFAWDPQQPSSLVWVATDGNILEENAGEPRSLERLELGGDSIVGIHFFSEFWQDAQMEPTPYVLIQSQPVNGEAQQGGTLWFVPRKTDAPAKLSVFSKTVPRDLVLAVSPSDSILASGDSSGTLRIWFASPEFRILSPVYDLPSDGDAKIVQVVFSGDGETLLSSDNKNRLAGWMSRDSLAVPSE
jgi:WD40 repeat protein